MVRGTLAALAMAGLLAVGCDDNDANNNTTNAGSEVKDAAQKTGGEAADALEKAQERTQEATEATKDRAENAQDRAEAQRANTADATKEGADDVQSSIDDLIGKAKDAVKEMKWTDAENYVKQIEEKKSMLPADKRAPVESALAEVKKLIQSGKSLNPAGAGANK